MTIENNAGQEGGNNNSADSEADNNNGQVDELSSFWSEPSPAKEPSPQGGSAGGANEGDGESEKLSTQLGNDLAGLKFGSVFSDKVVADLGEGNFEGVNQAIQANMTEAVKQSVLMNIKVLQSFESSFMNKVQQMMDGKFDSKEGSDLLAKEFPALASSPKTRPMVDRVYEQAKKQSGGDNKKALSLTRDMLEAMGQDIGKEMKFNGDAPSEDVMQAGAKSLLDSLLSG